jgi:hypothetical protein
MTAVGTVMSCYTTERGLLHVIHPSLRMLTKLYQMGIQVAIGDTEALHCLQKGPFHASVLSSRRPKDYHRCLYFVERSQNAGLDCR